MPKKFTVCFSTLALAAVCGSATAAPLLSGIITPLGSDRYRVEIFADTGEVAPQAAGYTLNFQAGGGATLQHVLFNGAVAIETQSEGASFDGVLGYSLANDSWFDDVPEGGQGLGNNFGPTAEGANSLSGTFLTNSGSGQTFKSGRIAHLIVQGPASGTIGVTGNFAVAGLDFPQQGTIPLRLTPAEPTSMAIALLGLTGLAAARRRRSPA